MPTADAIKTLTDQLSACSARANLKSADATLAAIKQAMPKQNLADQIDPLNDRSNRSTGTLAGIQKSTALDGVKTQLAALSGKLERPTARWPATTRKTPRRCKARSTS